MVTEEIEKEVKKIKEGLEKSEKGK